MWPETLPRVRFASRPKIPLKFSTLSRSTSNPRHLVTFPTSSQSTPPIIPETTTWGKCLSPNTQTVSQAISVLATALRTAICSCYLLSTAIWRYLSTGRPCLSPVCNCLQTQIAKTPPVTFKASPSAPFSPLITQHTHTQTFNLEGWLV